MPSDKHLEAALDEFGSAKIGDVSAWVVLGGFGVTKALVSGPLRVAIAAYLRSVLEGAEAEKMKERYRAISHLLCESECGGRCFECPADVVQDTMALIESQAAALAEARERVEGLEKDMTLNQPRRASDAS